MLSRARVTSSCKPPPASMTTTTAPSRHNPAEAG
jgi:hypothetical protein